MISFDQVLLLEEKVESAVKKIEQLNAENVALRSKINELTTALNAKSEQFSTFQSDQSKIEEGILKALNRLNAVENVVLQAAAHSAPETIQPSFSQNNQQFKAESESDAQQTAITQNQESVVSGQTTSEPQIPLHVPTFDDNQSSEPLSTEPTEIASESAEPAQNIAESESVETETEPNLAENPTEEIDIPIQNGSSVSEQEIQPEESSQADTGETDTIAPNIDFDFGEQQKQENPQFENTDAALSENADDNSSEEAGIEPQALFDIF